MFKGLAAIATASILALQASPTLAAAVVIWPVDPVLQPAEKATVVWIENRGEAPVTMQIRALAWSQANGEDVLSDQSEIIASPPLAKVAPGERQLVRLVRRSAAPDGKTAAPQQAYRLLIDELPEPPAGDAAPRGPMLSVQMRYSIPLFSYDRAPDTIAPELDTLVVPGQHGRQLSIRNTGGEHARLTDLTVVSGGREQVVRSGLVGYVLPGATILVPLSGMQGDAMRVDVNGAEQALGPRT